MLRDQPCPLLPDPTDWDPPGMWLFTDERNDPLLERAIMRLPRRSGIVFRHYHLQEPLRRARFEQVKKLARRRGHIVFLAGTPALAKRCRADGVHGLIKRRSQLGGLLHSAPVHDAREIHRANRSSADIFFLSPVFSTRSHPGQRPLNPAQTKRLAALCNGTVIYLGGMNRQRYRMRKNHQTHGWAAIDALC